MKIVESSASGKLFSIYVRSDKQYMTEHTYANPRFVEDVVREIVLKLDTIENVI